MARPLRIEFPDAVYHVTSRGNDRQSIFADDQDRNDCLEILDKTRSRFNWLCHAYCLMDNHYHLLIETPDANLARGMRHLNGAYTQAFNRRHEKVGHLFQGRYKAIIVDRESYLLELVRYIVLNPVRAGFTSKPELWRWSSFLETAGLREAAPFLTTDWLLAQFGQERKAARQSYREFVEAGVNADSPWRNLKSQVFLGDDAFIERLRTAAPALSEKEEIREIPRQQRFSHRPRLEDIFHSDLRKGPVARRKRDEAIFRSYRDHGYTQKEISDFLRLHYTTISRAIKRADPKI